jgi:hypothetical protein
MHAVAVAPIRNAHVRAQWGPTRKFQSRDEDASAAQLQLGCNQTSACTSATLTWEEAAAAAARGVLAKLCSCMLEVAAMCCSCSRKRALCWLACEAMPGCVVCHSSDFWTLVLAVLGLLEVLLAVLGLPNLPLAARSSPAAGECDLLGEVLRLLADFGRCRVTGTSHSSSWSGRAGPAVSLLLLLGMAAHILPHPK